MTAPPSYGCVHGNWISQQASQVQGSEKMQIFVRKKSCIGKKKILNRPKNLREKNRKKCIFGQFKKKSKKCLLIFFCFWSIFELD